MQTKLLARSLLAFILIALFVSCTGQKVKPNLPCKTPEELKQALDFALNTHDTNFFWAIHAWTNVPPESERFHKAVFLQCFPQRPGDKNSFKSFRISPAPPGTKEIAARKDVSKPRFNIPIAGEIYCKEKSRRGGLGSSMTLEFPFGTMPDGTYWLAVLYRASSTNATSPRK